MKKRNIAVMLFLIIFLVSGGLYYGSGNFGVSHERVEEKKTAPAAEVDMDEVVSTAQKDGGEGAAQLKNIQDTETYEKTLRQILDGYYSTEGNEEKISEFSAGVEDRGKLITENYKNADKERKNGDDLDYVTGEVLVLFGSGTGEQTMKDVAEKTGHDVQMTKELDMGKVAVMELPLEYTVEEGARQLSKDDAVLAAQPNYIYQAMDETPDEPAADMESAQPAAIPDDRIEWYLTSIRATEAWDILPGGKSRVRVAVIDTGVRPTHEDLANVLNLQLSATIESGTVKKGVIADPSGHGTHVSGILAAEANNSLGIAGVASGYSPARGINNSIIDLMVIDADRGGFYTSDLLLSIDYAVNSGAKVINMSLGGSGHNSLLDESIRNAANAGVLCISAAGNESTDRLIYPGDVPEGIGVINTESTGLRRSSSNYGPEKDIAAPGVGIYSTVNTSDSAYGSKTGTSMSSPVVTGVAAMVLYTQPNISTKQLKNILYGSTGLNSFSNDLGFGGVDAAASVQAAKDLSPQSPTGVVLNRSTATVAQGNTLYLESKVSPANTSLIGLTWTSSNLSVAKVSQGTVQGIAPGTAVITAQTSNGKTAACTVTVTPRYMTVDSKSFTSTKTLTADSPLSTPVDSGDSMKYYYSYMNGYQYSGAAGEQLTLTASGTTSSGGEFDTYIKVLDSSGNCVAKNDDYGGAKSSQLTYTLPKTDTYYIEVSEAISGGTLQVGTITFQLNASGAATEVNYSPSKEAMTLRSMIVRSTPSTSAVGIGTFQAGTVLKLNGLHTTSGGVKWYKVYTNGKYGYILAQEAIMLASPGYVNYSPSKMGQTLIRMYVRDAISTAGTRIGTFESNYTIRLNGLYTTESGEKWYKINYNGKNGYIPAQYVRLFADPTYVSYSPAKLGTTLVYMVVRSSPSTSAAGIGTFKAGTLLKLNGLYTNYDGVKWYQVYTNGKFGYILAKDVRLQ